MPQSIDDFPLATEEDLSQQGQSDQSGIDAFPLASGSDLEKNISPGQALAATVNFFDHQDQEDPAGAVARQGHSELTKLAQGVPFFGHALTAAKNLGVASSAKKIKEGTGTTEDYVNVAIHLRQQRELSARGMPHKIVDTVMAIPGFGQEFLMTGGAFSLARGATAKAIGGLGEAAAAKALQATLPRAVGALAQTAANPSYVAQQASQRAVPDIQLQQNQTGEVADAKIGEDKSFLAALPAGYLDAAIEMGSERAGGHLVGLLKKIPGVSAIDALKEGVVGHWLSKPGRTTAMLNETLKQAGWNGVVGEVLEERAGDVARLATGLESPDQNVTGQLGSAAVEGVTGNTKAAKEHATEALNQLAVEGISFLAPGAVSIASHALPQQAQPDAALQSKLDAVQQQYVKDEAERKDNTKWLEQQALERDQSVSDSAYRQLEAEQRLQRQEADKAALDKHFRENMPQDVQPETIGGIRQLPLSPETQMPERTAPPVEQPPEGPLVPTIPNPISELYDPRANQAGREAELQAMSLAQVKEQATQLGLPKSLNKGAMIQQILTKEAGPQVTKSILRKSPTLTDAVSQTQQEIENAASAGQEQRGAEYAGAVEGAAPSENGPQIRREEGAPDRRGDSAVQGGQEAAVPADEVAHYDMLDFDSRGRLKARKKMPVDEAHRLLKGREVVFQKLLECLS